MEVTFLKKRPLTKIKLAIELEGKESEVQVDEGGLVRWTGEMCVSSLICFVFCSWPTFSSRCRTGTMITVHTYSRHRFKSWDKSWKKLASVETSLTEYAPPILGTISNG